MSLPKTLFCLPLFVSSFWATLCLAADYPTFGMLTGKIENDGLKYECERDSSNTLKCDFSQISVQTLEKNEEWPSTVAKLKEDWNSMTDEDRERQVASLCEKKDALRKIISGEVEQPEFGVWTSDWPGKDEYWKRAADAMTQACKNPTSENFVLVAEVAFDRHAQVCKITVHSFTQQFRKSKTGWSVISEPTGECGVVQLSKFEPEDNGIFWRYTARKAITNPDNQLMDMSCSELDEGTYPYSWEPAEKHVDCEFIRY